MLSVSTSRSFFKEQGHVLSCGRMVTETVPVEMPAEVLRLAERSGISREKIGALLRDVERLSREMRVSAWKRLSPYAH